MKERAASETLSPECRSAHDPFWILRDLVVSAAGDPLKAPADGFATQGRLAGRCEPGFAPAPMPAPSLGPAGSGIRDRPGLGESHDGRRGRCHVLDRCPL